MFERFTDRARRVLVLAQEEARLLNHSFIGTEHILLGLIHEGEGVAAKALESLGISLEAVREKVEETIGMAGTAPSGSPPFTPRAKKVLELSLREALQLGHSYIGTEHMLLGLVREGEGVAATVLVSLGADLGRVRQQVIQLLDGHGAEGSSKPRSTRAGVIEDVLARLDSMDGRLTAIERWVGMGPDVRDLDQEIAQLHRDKEAAIESQDFETAAAIRDAEVRLLADKAAREKNWAGGAEGRSSLAEDFGRLRAELERLRSMLRERGIEPGDDAA